jgi:hypothetical protein
VANQSPVSKFSRSQSMPSRILSWLESWRRETKVLKSSIVIFGLRPGEQSERARMSSFSERCGRAYEGIGKERGRLLTRKHSAPSLSLSFRHVNHESENMGGLKGQTKRLL